jgi:hydrolase, TatD family
VIERALQAGVGAMICIGADVPGSERSVALAQRYPYIFAGVGIHPHAAGQTTSDDILRVERLSGSNRVVAIGEIGLDYYDHGDPQRKITEAAKKRQAEVCCACIDIARIQGLPVVFHCREASDDMIKIIRAKLLPGMKAVMHCFSGDENFLSDCLDAGMSVSFTGNITYPKAENLRALIHEIPLERILIETDAPYLAPQAQRGRRNEPAFVLAVAEEIAALKDQTLGEIAEATTRNACAFFGIERSLCHK